MKFSGDTQYLISSEKDNLTTPVELRTYKEKYEYQLRKYRTYVLIYANASPELRSLIADTLDGATAGGNTNLVQPPISTEDQQEANLGEIRIPSYQQAIGCKETSK
ncbi:hypothetical protein HNY73_018867 [Argiope bruennichi]|uniref:Uncharacterized protein n=1 Tax=Argiope bruennichi TaxID=94029 RepID=A0A8T0EIE0_ARGBR|nr:hypothetical protein HNY73_018867 [Argiope bruennichi]